TIRNADLIVVLEHGKVIEQGTHDELLDREGLYLSLYCDWASAAALSTLRSLQAGVVIGKAWETYKAHWRHLLPIAFVVYVLISLLILLLGTLLWFGALVGFVVSIAGVFWLQGALVLAVDDVRDGRADLSISQTLDRV